VGGWVSQGGSKCETIRTETPKSPIERDASTCTRIQEVEVEVEEKEEQ